MDDPDLDAQKHHRALEGLARINKLSRADAALWPQLLALKGPATGTFRILDVAGGAGDVAIRLLRRARRERVDLAIDLADISATALDHARTRAAHAGVHLGTLQLDVLKQPLPPYDAVMCSLFLHHLSDADAVTALTRMRESARRGVVISDLRRTALGLLLAKLAPRLATRSPVVHTDAVRSVHAAYTEQELRTLLDRAGLTGAQLLRVWPQRMLAVWSRP